jgi:hypothetical protein
VLRVRHAGDLADIVAAAVAIGTASGVLAGAAAASGTTPRRAAENIVFFAAFGEPSAPSPAFSSSSER